GDIPEDQLHEPDMVGERLPAIRVAPQGAGAGSDELRPGPGVAAGEQRDLVPQPNQLLRQVGNDALRAAVQARGDTLVKGGDLCNSHGALVLGLGPISCWRTGVVGIGPGKMPLIPQQTSMATGSVRPWARRFLPSSR